MRLNFNSIFVIKPYKWENIWVFDDDRAGLVREPFVAGTDDMLDAVIRREEIPNPDAGVLLYFSSQPFPGAHLELDWLRQEFGGNLYAWRAMEMEGWLCPSLSCYFQEPPEKLYVQIKPTRPDSPGNPA